MYFSCIQRKLHLRVFHESTLLPVLHLNFRQTRWSCSQTQCNLLERAANFQPRIFARRLRICKTRLFVETATILRGLRIWNVTPGSDLGQLAPFSRCLAKICPEIEATLSSFAHILFAIASAVQRHRSAPLWMNNLQKKSAAGKKADWAESHDGEGPVRG